MSDMTPEKAQALLDGATPGPWVSTHGLDGSGYVELAVSGAGGEAVVGGCGCCGSPFGENPGDVPLMTAAPDVARAYIAQAAELTRLRARIEAADKLLSAANSSLLAEIDDNTDLLAKLGDPVAVHASMLRGTIAKPTVEQIIHLYGADALVAALSAYEGAGK